ncbi:hypothetical protein FXO38_20390 [Capsicum annuum]|nr:hypothetical protein FXO38_20390 [Capsicum annuum]
MDDWFTCCCVTNVCLPNISGEFDVYVVYRSLWSVVLCDVDELSSFVVILTVSAIFGSLSIDNSQFWAFVSVDGLPETIVFECLSKRAL